MSRFAVDLLVAAFVVAGCVGAARADERCCTVPERYADGTIKRSASVLREFQRIHRCPSTGLPEGSCPGWYRDHVIPLSCGGADIVENLQWLPEDLWRAKSKFERRVYGGRGISEGCP